ncbi:MAG: alcohol dehydrogenase catalytic domain-containing protein [Bryobacterales bacterium]|nr:alcohol dehydrogenase catalytic domain-containing protein [Bryobacterales bacterium]MBV9398498.1 alcohol dehydrogenase catalytic domain-containing protein [Bryobacterales bacterium]
MESKSISRRKLIKRSAAAGAAISGVALQAQSPGVLRGSNAGRKFRAYVTRPGKGSAVEELTLLPVQPRQVLVRIEACAPCYTTVPRALPQASGTANRGRAEIPNHAAVGVVEEIGALVKRVQKGDRVVVAGTSQCGQCYQCLHGDPDFCQFTFGGDVFPPFATASDGTAVAAQAGVGGSSELAVVTEEYLCPVFTSVPAVELSLLGDQLTSGFAAGMCRMKIEAGSNVVVFGAGPVGLGAVQAGRVMGAAQVIVIEPIRYRRELAMRLGATMALDPNAEGAGLVEKIRELCKGPTDRKFAGGEAWITNGMANGARGADFTINASGMDNAPPKVERGPDPTGLLAMQQAWECTRMGGHLMYMGMVQGNFSLNGTSLALLGRTIHPGQQGGFHMMRDIPRIVKLMERGLVDAKTMIQGTYPLEKAGEAYQEVADRTKLSTVILMS